MKTFYTDIWILIHNPLLWLKGGLVFLIGPLNIQLAYLLMALAIDLAFGIQIALRDKTFKWKILFSKLRHKLTVYGLWIAMFHAFDMVTGLPDSARWSVIVLLAGLEIVSAIKNTAKLGHNQLAEGLERLYLSLTKSQVSTPKTPEQKSIPQVPALVSDRASDGALSADAIVKKQVRGGNENA